ncbi:MAG: DUF1080 domain-containing protein, partial [Planctomycetaceae bacterium]|nr:DUF1080 domain-containing protein [Planctomycetaceae bacterium]
YLQQFIDLLKKKDDSQWKTVLDLANQLKSPQTSRLIIEHFDSLSNEKKATLLEVIGSRKDAAVVPELIEFAQGNEPITKIAAVKTLGRIGDFRGLDAILHAVSSSDKNLADVGKACLGLIQGADFNATIIKILDSKEKAVRLAALHVIGERHIAEAAQKVTVLFNDSDTEIRLAAYQTFAQAIVPTTDDFERLLISFQTAVEKQVPVTELDVLRDALKTVCRKMPDRNASIAVIEKKLKTADTKIAETENQVFFMELLFSLGGEQAVKVVAAAALATPHDAVRDKATDILGRWTTPDVAPFLFDLAQKFPAGTKYQVRTLRGYIRVIRQMGIAVDEKVEMSKKALSLAKRDEDKQLAQETLERFSRIVRGTPLFDGKTYENWEFRNNENARWFRIENAAIVGGTFKEKIPRNEFITTKQEYGDFTLRLEVKVIGEGANAGVQFRSQRLPQNVKNANEVAGYQADMTNTFKFWGSLYDESRRNKFLAEADAEIVKPIFRKDDWNELEIVCKGDTIKISLNGVQTIEYTETDENIPRKGIIGLQIHSGNPSEAWYRNIRIE